MRLTSLVPISPSRDDRSPARHRPQPTASPCSQRPKPGQCLDRVPERVPEIQQRALALFALIAPNDARLDLAGARDRVRKRLLIQCQQRRQLAHRALEVIVIGQKAMLEHFRQPCRQLARRQAAQHRRVGHDHRRLVKSADQVLAGRMVDAGLAADRGIDLRQQRGRHLHHAHAAHEYRRGKAGDVAHDPAAQCHHDAAAVRAGLHQRVDHLGDRLQILRGLAVADHAGGGCGYLTAAMLHRIQVQRPYHGVGNYVNRGRCQRPDEFVQPPEQSRGNRDVVGVGGQFDRDALHL